MNKRKFKPCKCGHGTAIHVHTHLPRVHWPCCKCRNYRQANVNK